MSQRGNDSHALSTPQERQEAERHIVKLVQSQTFVKEIQSLRNSGRLKPTSKIVNLIPFVDSEGILQVGGRLWNEEVPDSMKHPAIIPKRSNLTRLLISYFHIQRKTIHYKAPNIFDS